MRLILSDIGLSYRLLIGDSQTGPTGNTVIIPPAVEIIACIRLVPLSPNHNVRSDGAWAYG